MELIFIFTPREPKAPDALEVIFNDLDERRVAHIAQTYPQSIFFYAKLEPSEVDHS